MSTHVTVARLSPEDGALRLRLDEPDWVALHAVAGSPAGLGLTAPLSSPAGDPLSPPRPGSQPEPEPGSSAPEPAWAGGEDPVLLAAIEGLAGGLATLDVATSRDGTGLISRIVVRADSVAAVTRVIASPPDTSHTSDTSDNGAGGSARAVPGVEVSAYPVGALVGEVLRLLPPPAEDWTTTPGQPAGQATDRPGDRLTSVTLPADQAATVIQLLATGTTTQLDAALTDAGLNEVPAVLTALSVVHGDATIVITTPTQHPSQHPSQHPDHQQPTRFLRLLLTRHGWVRLNPTTGGIEHTATRSEEITTILTQSLATALDTALETALAHADTTTNNTEAAHGTEHTETAEGEHDEW